MSGKIKQMKGFLKELLITLGLALVIFLLLQTTIQSSIVLGSSMEPGMEDGQRLIINKAVYHFHEPARGDVIILRPPIEPHKEYVKRVIGIPGDTVEVRSGVVYVNGLPLKEPYIKEIPRYNFASFTVPENNYFVLGDNRNNSNDSHTGWTVTGDNIVGEAWLRIWPINEWGTVPGYSLSEQLTASDLENPSGPQFVGVLE
jgi:signal peptidase I